MFLIPLLNDGIRSCISNGVQSLLLNTERRFISLIVEENDTKLKELIAFA